MYLKLHYSVKIREKTTKSEVWYIVILVFKKKKKSLVETAV